MRNLILVLTGVLIHSVSLGQPKGYSAVVNPDQVKEKLATQAKKITSVRSHFSQEKNLSMLSEKITSTGMFQFRQPGQVRMEYTEPFKYLLVISNDRVTIRDGQKTNSFSARSNTMFTLINRVIMDCIRGTAFSNTDFHSDVYERTGQYLIVMKPLNKELQGFFEAIHVYIDASDGTVLRLDLREPSGDNTLITFTDKELNVAIPDSEFVVR